MLTKHNVPLWIVRWRCKICCALRLGVVRCCGGTSILVLGWVSASAWGLYCWGSWAGVWGVAPSRLCWVLP